MARIGLIGGTGLNRIDGFEAPSDLPQTPYGSPSAGLARRRWGDHEVVFLARHGQPHRIAPHQINYRANLWALKRAGIDALLASNAVGGISASLEPGALVLPDQLIDYSWGRDHSFAGTGETLRHVEFGEPYDLALRGRVVAAAARSKIPLISNGTYGCTQGPRLETAAEIDRLERDGCDLVGMTGMPEAGLARELDLPYVALCLVVNKAAGRGDGPISEGEIGKVSRDGMGRVVELIDAFVELFE